MILSNELFEAMHMISDLLGHNTDTDHSFEDTEVSTLRQAAEEILHQLDLAEVEAIAAAMPDDQD